MRACAFCIIIFVAGVAIGYVVAVKYRPVPDERVATLRALNETCVNDRQAIAKLAGVKVPADAASVEDFVAANRHMTPRDLLFLAQLMKAFPEPTSCALWRAKKYQLELGQ